MREINNIAFSGPSRGDGAGGSFLPQESRGLFRLTAKHIGLSALAAACILFGLATGAEAQSKWTDDPGLRDKMANQPVAVITLFREPLSDQNAQGAEIAAAEAKAHLSKAAPPNIDPPQAVTLFRDAVAAGAKAVVVDPFPGSLWVRPIDDAIKAHVIVNTIADSSVKSMAKIHVAPNDVELGAALADALADRIPAGSKGVIATGICVPSLPLLKARIVGFTNEMKRKRPELRVLDPVDVTPDPPKNFTMWKTLVTANPDTAAVVGVCDFDLANLGKVKSQDKGSKYLVGAVGGDSATSLAAIANGTATVGISQNPFVSGYVAMRLALMELAGEKVPHGWINSGYEVITSDNVQRVRSRFASAQASRQYYNSKIEAIFRNLPAATKPLAEFAKTLAAE